MKSDTSFPWHRRAPAYQTVVLTTLLTLFGTGLPTLWARAEKWTSIGPFSASITSLAIDPQNPRTLYVGTERGVFKSTDGGASWDNINPTLYVFSLAIDPRTPSTLYASSYGVFKSIDGGANWSAASAGLPGIPTLPLVEVYALAIDSQNPGTIYASGGFPTALMKSTDGGATWFVVSSAISFSTLAIGPQGSNTLYGRNSGGVFKSTDAGLSWVATGLSSGAGFAFLVIDPQDPGTVYASGDDLFKTADGGANWTKLNSGLSTVVIQSLALDPQNARSIFATNWGLLKSTDAGSNWSRVMSDGDPNFYPVEITIDPQNPDTIYAESLLSCDEGPPHTIAKSTDGGSSWRAAMSGLPFLYVNALVIDSTTPSTIYTGTDKGVFKSIDAAASWSAANVGLPGTAIFTLAVDPRTSSKVYAGGSAGVFKSADGGASWTAGDIPTKHSFTVLAIDPQNPSTVYAGGSGAIFKSVDSGTTWTPSSTDLPSNANWMSALLIDPLDPSTLYAGTSGVTFEPCSIPCGGFNDGVFRSTDAGATWAAVNSGLTTSHVSSLAIDPQNPNRLYAGTIGGGVFAITFGPAPVVTDFRFNQTNVAAGGSYSVTVSGSNLTPQTFFDVRFSSPGSSTSNVVLNWQKGLVASHDVPAGITAGTWTITGVRAHELEGDHTDSFVPISAVITVSH